jgi:hypothetical protein
MMTFGDSFEDNCWDSIIDVSDDYKYQSSHLIQIAFGNGSKVGFKDGTSDGIIDGSNVGSSLGVELGNSSNGLA